MPDSIFLEVTESKDAAGKNRPEFCLGKLPLLDIALIDLIIECSLGIFKQCINFIEGGTESIFEFSVGSLHEKYMLMFIR